jgi:dCTP deaminase
MSVLSAGEVLRLLRVGEIYLSPILDGDNQIGPISIDLRLGHVGLFVRASGLSHVDPSNYTAEGSDEHQRERSRRQKFSRFEFTFDQNLLLHPGSLTLVPTLEWIQLPSYIKGVVTARSSWAREGLSIATANFINPGYNGIITLELANLGQIPISLYPGMRIAQISFYRVGKPGPRRRGSQFDMSFDPRGGEIARGDEPFIPCDEGELESKPARADAPVQPAGIANPAAIRRVRK